MAALHQFSMIDRKVIQLFLEIEFPWKPILIEQLEHTEYSADFCNSSYFLDFIPDSNSRKIQVKNSVPIIILINHEIVDAVHETHYENTATNLPYKDISPSGFYLHVQNGYIKTLEVVSLAGEKLQLNKICEGKRYYMILN